MGLGAIEKWGANRVIRLEPIFDDLMGELKIDPFEKNWVNHDWKYRSAWNIKRWSGPVSPFSLVSYITSPERKNG